ncbi:hypothetical protein [Bacillus norwichensis]|uniref:Uncharacterized protein n=1 Tax=Bacillus norwichensis TaxID=2762217 RepID=A0ABR8VNU8_9BACI|nr:hypothetical protein [Bacillus norwichensis]MBD8006111.1 hypothetical protein [Bacillus norwichensis]
MIILIFSMIIIGLMFYNRYIPVLGIKSANQEDINHNDCRYKRFNESYKNPVPGALTIPIPIAYLKRNGQDIPSTDLFLRVKKV